MSQTIWINLMVCAVMFGVINGQLLCRTPSEEEGKCVKLSNCPSLLILLNSNMERSSIDYLRQSHCGFEGPEPIVCCSLKNPDVVPGTSTSERPGPRIRSSDGAIDLRNHPLLPANCGNYIAPKIIGGQRMDLDEHPWMVLLEYNSPGGMVMACGGVLISKRYVLTAAHCLKGKTLPKNWKLTSVRLGEYDTESSPDCIPNGDEDGQTCADEVISVNVEEEIPHEQYNPETNREHFDIALLRLSRDITFTHYIQAICLPINGTLPGKAFVAGWGKTEDRSESNVKLKVQLPIVPQDSCTNVYRNSNIRLNFESQLCAGGLRGKDSCKGDSGGPMMTLEMDPVTRDAKWVIVGVVSFGPSPCGLPNWPGVYTKVHHYTDWILQKIRA